MASKNIQRKLSRKYYFSVEGETEKWYLEWLEFQINASGLSDFKVSIDCQVEKDPCKRVKRMSNIGKISIWHLSDYESDDSQHAIEFQKTMDQLKKAEGLGKQVGYSFGYSNLTFDLWVILHKTACNSSQSDRNKYLSFINKNFNSKFQNMEEYKRERNFKKCLDQLELNNVLDAIDRAKRIMDINKQNGYHLVAYKGYSYYKENPSLEIWRPIEIILKECKIIK